MKQRAITLFAAASVCAGAAWLMAGDLNPPAGPVQPTMRTLDEVFDAVQGAGGPGAACTLGIPGSPRGNGVVSLPAIPGATGPISFDIFSFSHKVQAGTPGGTGGPSGPAPVFSSFSVVREIDAATPLLYRALTSNTEIADVKIDVRATPGGTNYFRFVLRQAAVVAIEPRMVVLCDGSYRHLETVEFAAIQVQYLHTGTGNSWNWNIATNSGN